MFITGIGTAAPPHRYKQSDCWRAVESLAQVRQLNPRSRAILKKVLNGDNGISTRHMALENLADAFQIGPDILHARFLKHAPALAAQAAERAMKNSKIEAKEIDAVIISTCTGYLCPGLTSYVAEQLGLRADVLALDLVGQGCGAALPNLRTAEALLNSNRAQKVLSICVEICSAAFYLDDDPGVLVSACLFGDGAGAAVLTNSPNENRRVEWKSVGSILDPAKRDLLRFEQRGGMLRNILTSQVPAEASAAAKKVFEDVLRESKVRREQITGWIWHAGGRNVLVALREKFKLSEFETRWSAAVLDEFGNVSSPCVFFVLERALAENAPGADRLLPTMFAGPCS